MMFKKISRRKKNSTKKRRSAWLVCGLVFLFIAVVGLLAWKQLKKYEQGILEVYALQQDGYVQLVLDQINLQEDRDNEELVQNILGTLDASDNHYWTLSEIDSIVFVKDVLETNRYKGFTTKTYYKSQSAEQFIESLQEGRVVHKEIVIKNRSYVASGVRFAYNGKNYYMCLLTSASTILDQNEYLSARTSLSMLVLFALAVVLCGGILLSILAERWHHRYEASEREKKDYVATIERMNFERSKEKLYHPRYMAFYVNSLPMLLEKIGKREAWPVEMMIVDIPSGEQRDMFLDKAKVYLDEKTFRVILDDRYVALLSIKSAMRTEESAKDFVEQMGATLVARRQPQEGNLEQLFGQMWKEVKEDGQ